MNANENFERFLSKGRGARNVLHPEATIHSVHFWPMHRMEQLRSGLNERVPAFVQPRKCWTMVVICGM